MTLAVHRTPLFGVETDLLGDSVPAARALRAGEVTPQSFLFRGPGYPLMLAAASALAGGDEFLGARLLNVAAALAAAAAAFLLVRRFLGPAVGLAVTLAMLLNPVFLRAAIEAGTDLPAAALALAATVLVARPGGPRGALAAGVLAGVAALTRYNMLFLAPAGLAALWLAGAARRRVLGFLAGLALTLGGWVVAHLALTGEPPRNQNYVNVAYEVYGRGMGYDRFWVLTGDAFRSFLDVLRHDPPRFLAHVGRNLAVRWLEDAQRLMPLWIGLLALPGMLVAWWRRPGWPTLALHAGGAYLVLAFVFYTPRFFLYLLPFYLSGAFGLLLASRAAGSAAAPDSRPPWLRRVAPVLAAAMIAGSGVVAVVEARRLLADPPDETRVAGELLRALGRPDQAVLARKPHVAYFAGMRYLALPYRESLATFLADARRAEADYLFVSGIETGLHPQLSMLADPGVALPGLTPLAHRVLRPGRYFALYRVEPGEPAPQAVEESVLVAIRRFVARRPGEAWPQAYLGGHLVAMGRFREALPPLADAARLDPRDALVPRFQALAHLELGETGPAAAACERALALAPDGAWERGLLGRIRLAQGRYAEARAELRRAMAGAVTDPRHPALYLEACAADGAWQEAAETAERILRQAPDDARARLLGARAWLALGREDRARAIARMPGATSGPESAAWSAFADSLRTPPDSVRPRGR